MRTLQRKPIAWFCLTLAIALASWRALHAHPTPLARAAATLDDAREIRITIHCEVTCFILGAAPGHLSDDQAAMLELLTDDELKDEIERKKEWFLGELELRVRGDEGTKDKLITPAKIEFPPIKDIRALKPASVEGFEPQMLPIVITAKLPADAKRIAFRFAQDIGSVVLTLQSEGREPIVEIITAGRVSSALPLPAPIAPVANGTASLPDAPAPDPEEDGEGIPQGVITAGQFLALGAYHIVPEGLDHILFVLGLFLLSAKMKPLLWQVTAFTVAHSVTLALAMYDIVRISPDIVEPLIAASIAFIALENVFTSKLKPWRPVVVFGFGLLHGLGFAGVLSELELPREQFVPALVGFNIGVELGQLAVIAAAFIVVGWFRERKWYRPAVTIPASLAIACVGLYWAMQRVHWI